MEFTIDKRLITNMLTAGEKLNLYEPIANYVLNNHITVHGNTYNKQKHIKVYYKDKQIMYMREDELTPFSQLIPEITNFVKGYLRTQKIKELGV